MSSIRVHDWNLDDGRMDGVGFILIIALGSGLGMDRDFAQKQQESSEYSHLDWYRGLLTLVGYSKVPLCCPPPITPFFAKRQQKTDGLRLPRERKSGSSPLPQTGHDSIILFCCKKKKEKKATTPGGLDYKNSYLQKIGGAGQRHD